MNIEDKIQGCKSCSIKPKIVANEKVVNIMCDNPRCSNYDKGVCATNINSAIDWWNEYFGMKK